MSTALCPSVNTSKLKDVLIRNSSICTSKISKIAIVISLLVAFVCSLQWPVVYRVVECWDTQKEHSYSIIAMRDNPTSHVCFAHIRFKNKFHLDVFSNNELRVACCV